MKIQENRRFLALFCMLGFLIGIIYANLMSKDHIASMGIFNEFFLNQYSQEEINMPEYLWYIVRIRVMPAILVAALGCTKLRRGVVAGFLIWTGFCGGMIMTAAVLKMGIKGTDPVPDRARTASGILYRRISDPAVVSLYLSGFTMESV